MPQHQLPLAHEQNSIVKPKQSVIIKGSVICLIIYFLGTEKCNYNSDVILCGVFPDAKKQSEMAALTKERDSLQNAIKTYRSLFETSEALIRELRSKCIITLNSGVSVSLFCSLD